MRQVHRCVEISFRCMWAPARGLEIWSRLERELHFGKESQESLRCRVKGGFWNVVLVFCLNFWVNLTELF